MNRDFKAKFEIFDKKDNSLADTDTKTVENCENTQTNIHSETVSENTQTNP